MIYCIIRGFLTPLKARLKEYEIGTVEKRYDGRRLQNRAADREGGLTIEEE